jgi:hypothetical protein
VFEWLGLGFGNGLNSWGCLRLGCFGCVGAASVDWAGVIYRGVDSVRRVWRIAAFKISKRYCIWLGSFMDRPIPGTFRTPHGPHDTALRGNKNIWSDRLATLACFLHDTPLHSNAGQGFCFGAVGGPKGSWNRAVHE